MSLFNPRPLEKQGEILAKHLPLGKAWNLARNRDSNMGKLVFGLAMELYRVEVQTELIANELDPRVTTQLITEWEKSLDLPDSCFDRDLSLEQRRQAILLKLNQLAIITVEDFEELARFYGLNIRVEPAVKHYLFPLRFPAHMAPDAKTARFIMWVHLPENSFVFPLDFPCELSPGVAGPVRCLINKLAPATVRVVYFFDLEVLP